MKVKLPAKEPKKPLITPDIRAIEVSIKVVTFLYNLIFEIKRHIGPGQITGHTSYLHCIDNMENGGMETLQRYKS